MTITITITVTVTIAITITVDVIVFDKVARCRRWFVTLYQRWFNRECINKGSLIIMYRCYCCLLLLIALFTKNICITSLI